MATNIFKRLGESFTAEDFFTGSLAVFIERNDAFREAFLKWLENACGESLCDYAWKIDIQSGSASCAGNAILDMKLRHPEIELWFEHKIGAALGRHRTSSGREIDQIEKYLDAAARVMSGIEVGDDEVDWPTTGPVEGQPRVLLFYVSRSGTLPEKVRYEGRLHEPGGYGLVWPAKGQLCWRDFWPEANLALEPVLAGESGDFERTLTQQFLRYWKALPNMWRQIDYDSDWQELLTCEPGERYGFEPHWDGVRTLIEQTLGWSYSRGYLGSWLAYNLSSGPVDQVALDAHASLDKLSIDPSGLEKEVIQLQFRARGGSAAWAIPGKRLTYERWRGVSGIGKTKGRDFLRIYVGVAEWRNAHTQEQRTRAVTGAVIAGLKMFEQLSEEKLPGMEKL